MGINNDSMTIAQWWGNQKNMYLPNLSTMASMLTKVNF